MNQPPLRKSLKHSRAHINKTCYLANNIVDRGIEFFSDKRKEAQKGSISLH